MITSAMRTSIVPWRACGDVLSAATRNRRQSIFERAHALEAVAFVGTDFRAHVPGWLRAFELGIAFVSTPGANAVSVAEYAIRLMLIPARPLPPALVGRELEGG